MKSDDSGCDSETNKTFPLEGRRHRVVWKRWGISIIVCFITVLDVFGFGSFSFVNDITSRYFRINPAITDLQAIANLVGRLASVVVICVIGGWISLRQITLLACVLNGFATVLVTMGVLLKIFPLLCAGMFLSGSAAGVIIPIAQLVSVNWFPLHERGKASAMSSVTRRLASLMSNLVATRAMGISYSHQELQQISTFSTTSDNIDSRFRIVFASTFGSLSVMSLLCCVLVICFVSDKPPVCENGELLNDPEPNEKPPLLQTKTYSLIRELKDVACLFTYRPYAIFFILYSFAMTDRAYGATLISSLILKQFPYLNDQFVGLLLIIGIVTATAVGPIVGQILDKFSKPRLTIICVSSLLIFAFSGSVASFHYNNIAGVYVSYLMLTSTRSALMICLKHRGSGITANMPSSIRLKSYSILMGGGVVFLTLSTACVRALMDNFSPAFGVLFPMPFLLCFFMAILFLWSYLKDPKQV